VIFLIVYDTIATKLLEINEYDDGSRAEAMADLRRKQETLLADLNHVEVALFEAESRTMLEKTHSRYFKSLEELGTGLSDIAKKSA